MTYSTTSAQPGKEAAVSHGRSRHRVIPRLTFCLQGAQKPWAFQISVVQGIGEEHDAPGVAAVPEPAGVAQLVDGFLDSPLQKEGVLGWLDKLIAVNSLLSCRTLGNAGVCFGVNQ